MVMPAAASASENVHFWAGNTMLTPGSVDEPPATHAAEPPEPVELLALPPPEPLAVALLAVEPPAEVTTWPPPPHADVPTRGAKRSVPKRARSACMSSG